MADHDGGYDVERAGSPFYNVYLRECRDDGPNPEMSMQCEIYKSARKQDTYLYVTAKDDFSRVPDALMKMIGQPIHVMELELHPDRKLAREDTDEVLRNLQQRGWHLQMPRQEEWQGVKH